MADARGYNVEDRIRELGESPEVAYANAKLNGMAGDAPPPTTLPADSDPLSSSEYPSAPDAGPPMRAPKVDPFNGGANAIVDRYAPPADGNKPLQLPQLSVAPQTNTGSIADAVAGDVLPSTHSAPAVSQPLEGPEQSWGAWLTSGWDHAGSSYDAAKTLQYGDNSMGYENALRKGYAPIVAGLGLGDSENPANYADSGLGNDLLTLLSHGLHNRGDQEQRLADLIRAGRAKDPHFMAGVPDNPAQLRQFALAEDTKERAAANATIAAAPSGLGSAAGQLGGSAVASMADPAQWPTLAIGGEAKTALQVIARDALINGTLTALQLPGEQMIRAQRGEAPLTAGEAATQVAGGAVGGAVFGVALHGAGKAIAATGIPQAIGGTVADLFKRLPPVVRTKWAGRVDGSAPVGSFFSHLDNRELGEFARDASGDQLTPQQTAAAAALERTQEVGETSPFQPGPVGDGTHDNTLASVLKDLEDHKTPEVAGFPSVPAADGSEAASVASERPPAPSTAARPQTDYGAPQDTNAAIQSFMGRVYHAENNTGNIHAQNPHSTASGPAQFTDSTFRQYYQKVYGVDPGAHADRNLKDQPEVQARLLAALTHDNAARLEAIHETINSGNLYVMHVLGEGDGAKVFKANPETPMRDLVSEKVLSGNPQFRNMSASEAIAWAHHKMGVSDIASVHSAAGPLETATNDPRIAQLNDEALQLGDAALVSDEPSTDWGEHHADDAPVSAGETDAKPVEIPPMSIATISNRDINVDAERFQFKSGGDEQGVTDRLQGVQKWNPIFAGLVTVWEDLSGKTWIADGHQRLGLANRIDQATGEHVPMNAMVMREADGISAEDARTYAALKNIAEQDTKHPTGAQLVDAAKVARGFGPDALRAALPPKSALARDGAALARLSDHAFGAVYNDVVPADFAAVIGHLLPHNPAAHEAMIELLQKLDPANRGQAASIVRQAIAAGIHKEEQVDLFGTHEHVTTLMLEKAKMIEKVLAELRKMKLVHRTAAQGAETLERTGSKIAKAASEKEAIANAQAIETVNRLAYRSGPIADAINAAAAELKSGRGKLATLARDAAGRIRDLDLGALDRESARNPDAGEQLAGGANANSDAERAANAVPSGDGEPSPSAPAIPDEIGADAGDSFDVGQPGRGSTIGEEGSQLPTQRGDPEQPRLSELEQSTARFSDPDGPAVQQQAKSLFHDLKAELTATAAKGAVHPVTGEPIEAAVKRAAELRDSFPPVEGETAPGTHNLSNREPVPGGRTRGELRNAIVDKLLEPPAKVGHEAHLILGPPAAGKSTLADPIARARGARIIDSDDAKALLPEFDNGIGAAAVHEESARLAERASQETVKRGENVVLPLLGKTHAGVQNRIDDLVKAGYRVYVHMVDLPLDQAADRAAARYAETGRLVDPAYVRSVGTAPRETFDRIIADNGDKLGGHLDVSNEVPRGAAPRILKGSDPEFARELGLGGGSEPREGEAGRAGQSQGDEPGAHAKDVSGVSDQTDPAIAERNRQLAELGAKAPLRAAGDIDQKGEIGLPLMDSVDQHALTFRIGEDGEEVSAADLLKDLDADDAAINAIRNCL